MNNSNNVTSALNEAEIINKSSTVPCVRYVLNATNPLVVTSALDNKVNEAKIPNNVKWGFTWVTSKIFKNTKHRPAKPKIQESKMETG